MEEENLFCDGIECQLKNHIKLSTNFNLCINLFDVFLPVSDAVVAFQL